MGFPKDFVWGAAAASYQIEGAADADGKGPSIWDMYSRTPGAVYNGHTGDVGPDHYHRYKEDVALMKEIGLQAYRFSISWPRVIPSGIGAVNGAGLDFYDRLVDELLAAGIAPYVTLFHWDYPYELYLRGGWLNPESPDWFSEYAAVVVDKLSDRVTHWMTLNEPQVFIVGGYHGGGFAPGLKLDVPEVFRAIHNTLLSHGKGVAVIRDCAKKSPKIGMVTVGHLRTPATDSPEDIYAAREATFSVPKNGSLWANPWWLDPVYLGHYPEDALRPYSKWIPDITAEDIALISQPLDFFALNIYNSRPVRAGADGEPEPVPEQVGAPQTAFRWPVTPECLYWGPKFLYERYKLPILITENGLSNQDWISLDGKVHDPQRIDFLTRYLSELEKAGREGVDIRGYFHWSIMDNFEWAQGYRERFGLIYIDYSTCRRVLKDSAYWYSDVIRSNGESLHVA